MRIFFYPEGTSVEQAVKFANSIVLSNRWQKVNRYDNPDTDFTEGFIPRVHKILDEFVWTDTNEKLNSDG